MKLWEMEGSMRFSIITISFLMSVFMLTRMTQSSVVCPVPVPEQFANVQPGNIVAAYFASWDGYGDNKYTVEDMHAIGHKLTHVMYAFAKPNSQTGMCELQDPWADVGANQEFRKKLGGNFAKLLEFKKKFPHVKVLLSIGGGTFSKHISDIVKKGMWSNFVKSCVDLLDRYEHTFKHSQTGEEQKVMFEYEGLFDGLDFDWEWLNNVVPEADARAYDDMIVLFHKLLRERALKYGKKPLLTIALQVNASVYKALNLRKIVQYVDWFHVMAYNFTGPFSDGIGFNAPLCNPWSSYSIDNAIHGLMSLGVSPAQLVLGVPLYGHVFDQTDKKIGSPFQATGITGPLSYGLIRKNYVKNKSCEYKWHDKSSVPYMYCSKDKVFVSFDDERSVKEKAEYARQKHLKGLVFWRLGGDDDNHSLVHAI